jgi:tetratricopeptide (TPR) repeat protein
MAEKGEFQFDMTTTEGKIEGAKRLKDEGNELFKQQLFKKANVSYFKALAFTKGLPGRPVVGKEPMAQLAASHSNSSPLTPEQIDAVNELEVVLKTNLATCYVKLEDGNKALQYANEALEIKANAWKTLLRKGEALQLLKFHEKSIEAFDAATALAPDDSARTSINKAKTKTLQMMKTENNKQKKAFANIFEKERAEFGEIQRK